MHEWCDDEILKRKSINSCVFSRVRMIYHMNIGKRQASPHNSTSWIEDLHWHKCIQNGTETHEQSNKSKFGHSENNVRIFTFFLFSSSWRKLILVHSFYVPQKKVFMRMWWSGVWVNLVQARQAVCNFTNRKKERRISQRERSQQTHNICQIYIDWNIEMDFERIRNRAQKAMRSAVRWSCPFRCRRIVYKCELNVLFGFWMPAHDENNDVIDFVQFDRWHQGLQQTSRIQHESLNWKRKNHGQAIETEREKEKEKYCLCIPPMMYFTWVRSVWLEFVCVWKLIHL